MSGFDIATSLFRLLNVPSVRATIDGSIYKFNRPINSNKRDVVISIPEYNAGQLNTGYVDINVHVPNLNLVSDQTVPDLVKMQAVVDAILPLLTNVGGFDLNVRISGIPIRENNGQWHANIRVGFIGVDENLGVDVTLVSLTGVRDDFGGYYTVQSQVWSGKGAQVDFQKGSQLSVNSGKYDFNMRSDWLLPPDSGVRDNMRIVSPNGIYVIHGIIPDTGLIRVHTFKIDP